MPDCPVVLVHGFASSFEHGWQRHGWPDLLADSGRAVVPVELLGHGASAKPHEPEAYARLADHAMAQLPSPDVAPRLDIIGFSLGAITTLRLACAQPTRFRRIAVMGIGDGVLHPAESRTLIDALTSETGPEPDDLRGTVFRRLADQRGNDRAALLALISRPQEPVSAAGLGAIEAEVLVVVGDRDEAYPAARLAACFTDADLVVAPGVDHFSTPSNLSVIERVLAFIDG